MDAIASLPLATAYGILFAIVMARANATYWVARGLRTGADRTRASRLIRHGRVVAAEAFVQRWGAAAVPLSFFTVGLQTAVNATAGAIRMPLRRYLPAVIIGSLIWATIYSALGAFLVAAVRTWLA